MEKKTRKESYASGTAKCKVTELNYKQINIH